jgi:DNA polymerase
MNHLHIDIETYSSVDIKDAGLYKYIESPDFEILMVAYKRNDGPVQIIDLKQGGNLHLLKWDLLDENTTLHAHNATFERIAFKRIGLDIPAKRWRCSMIKAAYCGWPLSLDKLSKAMDLQEFGKSSTGKALIRYFCQPVKATKVNGGRTRNQPYHNLEKWEEFKEYCKQDVVAEYQVYKNLERIDWPELDNYRVDQDINDNGVLVDMPFVDNVIKVDADNSEEITRQLVKLTGLDNPNSPAQLKKWLGVKLGKSITSLAKDSIPALMEEAGPGLVSDVLALRQQAAKTSVKKYVKMQQTVNKDGRVRGLFQFYGANRTGRWGS